MLLWIVDLALESYGVILPRDLLRVRVLHVVYRYVPLFDSRLTLCLAPPRAVVLTDSLDSSSSVTGPRHDPVIR